MHSLHVTPALGAFVAGVMLADSPYRHEIEADVEPFRLILPGLFFLAVGMVLDINVVLADPLRVLALAGGLAVTKIAVLTLIEIGRASCRERVCQDVSIWAVAVS